ncbi:MAG TPA: DDE-type integrase/transposase/recombinase [Thermoplasmata archaeon]|nr:DDE-type integrase/transposase/recombinase [Thermoplasmata archaeon]
MGLAIQRRGIETPVAVPGVHTHVHGGDGFLGRRVPPEATCAAWDLFFRGASLEGIARHLRVAWSVRATNRAVLNWVRGYSRLLADYVESLMETRRVDGGRRWHEDIAVVHLRDDLRYVILLRGRGPRGRPILLAVRWAKDRGEGHAVAVLRSARARSRALPERIVSDKEWSFLRAYWRVLGLRHRGVRLVHGVPIAAQRHAVTHNNNPAEQEVRELKDWCRHMNGFASDASAADLLRGWFVQTLVANTHGRAWTWAERAGLHLGLPREETIRRLIERAVEWRRSRSSLTNW